MTDYRGPVHTGSDTHVREVKMKRKTNIHKQVTFITKETRMKMAIDGNGRVPIMKVLGNDTVN